MSDEDSPESSGFGPRFFMGGSPEDLKAAMMSAHERHQLAIEDKVRAQDRLIDEMTTEQLVTLNSIFIDIASCQDPAQYANYMWGTTSTILRVVRNVCPSCGEDHDAQALTETLVKVTEEEAHVIGLDEEESE